MIQVLVLIDQEPERAHEIKTCLFEDLLCITSDPVAVNQFMSEAKLSGSFNSM